MALVELSVVEQRYRAVLAVLAGSTVTEVASQLGVSRQTVSGWKSRYAVSGLAGLADRSRRPASCPHQAPVEVEAVVCELRRKHPGWGARRIAFVLAREGRFDPAPSRMTVYRILVRHGLIDPARRKRRREDYRRWQREAPMALWQMDIVGGVMLLDPVTGELTEAKVVTGIDDHSRYCVIACVVVRATGRAVCTAFALALRRFGVPGEVLTDNGKQFTDRFGAGGEVLFDRICRENGIAHRLTRPASPTTTGKVERFHQTLRRELLDHAGPFTSLTAAQAALDGWVAEYNTDRPHQALDMDAPADRFRAVPEDERDLLSLRLPAVLTVAPPSTGLDDTAPATSPDPDLPSAPWQGGAIEFERVVPASGNLAVAGKQFWLGPSRAGLTVTFWADQDIIHLLIAGARIKTVRSHLSPVDLATLHARGGRSAGPSPLPTGDDAAFELERVVNAAGIVSLGGHPVLAAEILAGRPVGIRIDTATLAFFDPDTRTLLRVRPNPLDLERVRRLRGIRPAGPPPRPQAEPVSVQRTIGTGGTICVCRQHVFLGRIYAGRTVTVHVAENTLAVELDGQVRSFQRTTTLPVRNLKAFRARGLPHVS